MADLKTAALRSVHMDLSLFNVCVTQLRAPRTKNPWTKKTRERSGRWSEGRPEGVPRCVDHHGKEEPSRGKLRWVKKIEKVVFVLHRQHLWNCHGGETGGRQRTQEPSRSIRWETSLRNQKQGNWQEACGTENPNRTQTGRRCSFP